MWYVLQVASGREMKMLGDVGRALEHSGCAEPFVPRCVRLRRYHGNWHSELAVLFPGYIFVDADSKYAEEIRRALCIFNGSVTPVCIGGGFHPIRKEEQHFLEGVMDGAHEIGISVGDIVGGKLVVEQGPLMHMVRYVRKIDRHKRTAEVGVTIFGEERRVRMGLEVRTKS